MITHFVASNNTNSFFYNYEGQNLYIGLTGLKLGCRQACFLHQDFHTELIIDFLVFLSYSRVFVACQLTHPSLVPAALTFLSLVLLSDYPLSDSVIVKLSVSFLWLVLRLIHTTQANLSTLNNLLITSAKAFFFFRQKHAQTLGIRIWVSLEAMI